MAASLLQRLDAANELLSSCNHDEAAAISKGQSDALLQLMLTVRVQPDAIGPIAAKIAQVPWHAPEERNALLAGMGQMASSRARAKMQNYEHVGCFLTEAQWRSLMSPELDFHGKAVLLCDHAASLGLRHPSEPTVAHMVGLLLVCSEGATKARALGQQYMRDVFLNIKNILKRRTKSPPVETIEELGHDPAMFARQHPCTFQAIFASSPPVPPKVSLSEVSVISQGICMRDRKRGGSPSFGPPAGCADPMAMMWQWMQSMQAMQPMPSMMSPGGRSLPLDNGARLQVFGRSVSRALLDGPPLAETWFRGVLACPSVPSPPEWASGSKNVEKSLTV